MKRRTIFGILIAMVAVGVAVDPAGAQQKKNDVIRNVVKRSNKPEKGYTQVDMFQAMKSGEIKVALVQKDATKAVVHFENKTNKPLSIKLPSTFAGVPTLKQGGIAGGGAIGGQGGGGFGGGNQGGNQGTGGGFGNGGGGAGGGGVFNIAAGRKGRTKVFTVCLEHGKKDPNPRKKYKIIPLETFTKKPEVIETCRLLGNGQLSQKVAQATAWHFTDGLSWEQLAAKIKLRLRNGYTERYFSLGQVRMAQQVATHVTKVANKTGKANQKDADDPYKKLLGKRN